MMKVLLFGATGNVGRAIQSELYQNNIPFKSVVRSEERAKQFGMSLNDFIVANPLNSDSLDAIFNGFDVVISAFGKSVSPNDKGKKSFHEVDLVGNRNILKAACKARVKKFIYISAFHSERYQHLNYFKVHHEFSEELQLSGLDFSIIKPPAIFSAFLDLIDMAKKGRLVNIGPGDKLTNPIFEGDLAKIVVNSIQQPNVTIELGGKNVYSRKQLNEIVHQEIKGTKKMKTIPIWAFKLILPFMKVFNHNNYDKFSFFLEVMQKDTIAPQIGEMSFEEYIKMKLTDGNSH